MRDLLAIIRDRHSSRAPFDTERPIPDPAMRQILEAARWAPTAHNMQNFEVIVVDDKALLDAIGEIRTEPSATFLRENYRQFSFSEEELLRKKTGVLASLFPLSWQDPVAIAGLDAAGPHAFPGRPTPKAPALLVMAFDGRKRAPASEGDVLGMMSLGCVMLNMWLMAESQGIGMQILSAFAEHDAGNEMRRILEIPAHMKIAFACRLGYLAVDPGPYLRVRREVSDFAHRNRYGVPAFVAQPLPPAPVLP
jgi:nitroreductase